MHLPLLRSQTIAIEERFKRIRTHAASNAGHPQLASTVCSNHVLREAQTLHALARRAAGPTDKGRGGRRQTLKRRGFLKPKKKVSAFHLRVSDLFASEPIQPGEPHVARLRRLHAKAVVDIKKSALRRRYLLKADRANRDRAVQRAREQARAESEPEPRPVGAWDLGSDQFPVAHEKLQAHLADFRAQGLNPVAVCHEQWCLDHGSALPPQDQEDSPAARSKRELCCERFGMGYCQYSFSSEQLIEIERNKTVLCGIANKLKDRMGYLLQVGVFDADGNTIAKFTLRCVAMMFNPEFQIYVAPSVSCLRSTSHV